MTKLIVLFACVLCSLCSAARLEEGEYCANGICNFGLKCNEGNTCSEDESAPLCFQKHLEARRRLDAFLIGGMMPRCEDNGDYQRVQCQGSVCSCYSKDGELIENFRAPIHKSQSQTCNCARDQYEYRQLGIIGKMFHCKDNGNYESIQCHGSVCFCADENGKQISSSQTVHISDTKSLSC